MPRSLWKGPFVDASFIRHKNQFLDASLDAPVNAVMHQGRPRKIWSRRSFILPEFLNSSFEIYNGKDFLLCQVTEEMIGHKFGEFASTRKKTIHRKKLKK